MSTCCYSPDLPLVRHVNTNTRCHVIMGKPLSVQRQQHVCVEVFTIC